MADAENPGCRGELGAVGAAMFPGDGSAGCAQVERECKERDRGCYRGCLLLAKAQAALSRHNWSSGRPAHPETRIGTPVPRRWGLSCSPRAKKCRPPL